VPSVVSVIPTPAARATATASVLAALIAFLAHQRAKNEKWMRERLPARPGVEAGDVAQVLAMEVEYEQEFARRTAERMTRDLPVVLAIPDDAVAPADVGGVRPAARRERALQGLLAREERYQRQHSEAMAARAVAAVDRQALRRESPLGAFWELDPTVVEHTAGCLVMGGKFWPWSVLDRVHPPRHRGCPCRLRSYGFAIAKGLMTPQAVRSVSDAIRAASGVVMEAAVADAALAAWERELALVEAAKEQGVLLEGVL
jgi:hypothetical protein